MNLFLFLIIICDGKRNYRDTQDHPPTKIADPVIQADDAVISADSKKPESTTNAIVETTSLPIRNIQVQISGKHEITLPEDDLYLAAKITEQNFNQTEYGNSLIWGWKALSRPEQDQTQMNGIDTKKLHLSKLAAGKYAFEVEVKGQGNYPYILQDSILTYFGHMNERTLIIIPLQTTTQHLFMDLLILIWLSRIFQL